MGVRGRVRERRPLRTYTRGTHGEGAGKYHRGGLLPAEARRKRDAPDKSECETEECGKRLPLVVA